MAAKAPFLTLETTDTVDTVADQNNYVIPHYIHKIRSVIVTVDETIYRPRPIEDPKYWEYLQSLETGSDDVAQHYFKQGNELLLWPTPATASSTITIRGRKGPLKDMSLDDY